MRVRGLRRARADLILHVAWVLLVSGLNNVDRKSIGKCRIARSQASLGRVGLQFATMVRTTAICVRFTRPTCTALCCKIFWKPTLAESFDHLLERFWCCRCGTEASHHHRGWSWTETGHQYRSIQRCRGDASGQHIAARCSRKCGRGIARGTRSVLGSLYQYTVAVASVSTRYSVQL